jgi:glycosyltransferase involved in cell wall biosynthesis
VVPRAPLRICCLTVQTPAHVIGGMALHTVKLGAALRALGHEVTIVTTAHPDGRARGTEHGVPVVYLADSVPGSQRGGWWAASRRWLAAAGSPAPYDVIWSESAGASSVARRLARGRAPHLVTVIHGTSPQMLRSTLNALPASGGARPLLRNLRRAAGSVARYVLVDPPVYRAAGAVIAVSEAMARSIRRFHGVAAPRLHVVPNSVDTAAFALDPAARAAVRAAHGLGEGAVVLLTLSMLTAQKGHDLAIEALARLRPSRPPLALLVVGGGPERAALEALARRRGVADAVHFAGPVDQRRAAAYHGAADVFLFPTRRVEGVSAVILEAMAAGRPVVATRIGGTSEAVVDGQTGYLVAADDVEMLSERVGMLADSVPLRAELGARGRERVEARFGVRMHAERFAAIASALVHGAS